MSLTRHKAGPIAIDFGSHALRVLQLAGQESRAKVLAAALHVYAPRQRQEPPERGETIDALRDILRERKFLGKRVVSGLSVRELVVKNIRLPEMPETELASAVRFEALERIAGLDEDAEIRFLPAGSVPGGGDSQQEVIVLAAPAAVVREHVELLSELGLESAAIDAFPCAVLRPFGHHARRPLEQEGVSVLVDIGWSGARIVIARGDRIVFTKTFDHGGFKFDRLAAEGLSVDLAKAGELRRKIAAARGDGCGPDTQIDPATIAAVDAAVRPGLEQLGKEIGLCLRYYAVTFRGERPDEITCVGGEALDAGSLEYLSQVAGLPCRVGFPLQHMTCGGAFSEVAIRGSMADWAAVAGLSCKPVPCAAEKVA